MPFDVPTRRRTLTAAIVAAAAAAALWPAAPAATVLPAAPAPSAAGLLPAAPASSAAGLLPAAPAPPVAGLLPAVAAAGACANAGATAAPSRALRAALLCLVRQERRAAGLGPLRRDRRIARAARRHARDMVRRGYFAHQRGGGPDLGARLSRAGWRGSAWGEAIAYGCGELGSPQAIVGAWLASPPHRAILLGAGFGRAGVGLARSAPCGRGGMTWVLDVGRS